MEVGAAGAAREPRGALPRFLLPISVLLKWEPPGTEVGGAGGSMAEFSSKSSAQHLTWGEY